MYTERGNNYTVPYSWGLFLPLLHHPHALGSRWVAMVCSSDAWGTHWGSSVEGLLICALDIHWDNSEHCSVSAECWQMLHSEFFLPIVSHPCWMDYLQGFYKTNKLLWELLIEKPHTKDIWWTIRYDFNKYFSKTPITITGFPNFRNLFYVALFFYTLVQLFDLQSA